METRIEAEMTISHDNSEARNIDDGHFAFHVLCIALNFLGGVISLFASVNRGSRMSLLFLIPYLTCSMSMDGMKVYTAYYGTHGWLI